MRRIGILGGTFDPIHFGHLRLAEEALEAWPLDEVLFVPAAVSPFKTDAPITDAEHRVEMVRRAIASNSRFSLSTVDVDRSGPSYTVDTVQRLREKYSADELVLIVGVDTLRGFPRWKDWRGIVAAASLFVGARPGEVIESVQELFPPDVLAPSGTEVTGENGAVADDRGLCYNHAEQSLGFRSGRVLHLYRTTLLEISGTELRARAAARKSLRYLTTPEVIDYIEQCHLYRNDAEN